VKGIFVKKLRKMKKIIETRVVDDIERNTTSSGTLTSDDL
jgi:hypothetical protein